MTSLWFFAVKLHTSRWLYSLTYERGMVSMIQRRKYDTIVNMSIISDNLAKKMYIGKEVKHIRDT